MGSWSKIQPQHSYHESENMDVLISMCCSALQHWYRHWQNFSPRIDVSGPPESTWSMARAEIAPPLKQEKPISSETLLNASGGATRWIADISANRDPFLARIRVSEPRRHTWSMARAEIAPSLKPEKLIRYMRNLIGFLKIQETDFVVSTPQSNCQFLILGQFGEATKISILLKIKHAINVM